MKQVDSGSASRPCWRPQPPTQGLNLPSGASSGRASTAQTRPGSPSGWSPSDMSRSAWLRTLSAGTPSD